MDKLQKLYKLNYAIPISNVASALLTKNLKVYTTLAGTAYHDILYSDSANNFHYASEGILPLLEGSIESLKEVQSLCIQLHHLF